MQSPKFNLPGFSPLLFAVFAFFSVSGSHADSSGSKNASATVTGEKTLSDGIASTSDSGTGPAAEAEAFPKAEDLETGKDSSGDSGSQAPAAAGEEVSGETAGESASPGSFQFVSPGEALVAIRGNSSNGVGTLVRIKGVDFVMTAISSLAPNSRITVTTVDGTIIPVTGLIGLRDGDLALLRIGEGEVDLPVAEASFDADSDARKEFVIQTPHKAVPVSASAAKDGRVAVSDLNERVFPGTPVVIGSKVAGVFSPARNVFGVAETSPSEGEVWSAGMVFLPSEGDWEPIDPQRLMRQSNELAEAAFVVRNLAALLNAGPVGRTTLVAQPLIAAQDRLRQGIEDTRDKSASDKERVFDRFVFSVNGFGSDVLPLLVTADRDFYGYMQPEVEKLKDLYKPVWEKVEEIKANPQRSSSYTR